MARPREFVESDVIDAARDAFWVKGYAATSINDLSEATGLSVGSIYKAFGSKSELCHRTLEAYADSGFELLDSILDTGATPLAGIESWLELMADVASTDGPQRGCYLVVCTNELAETDPVVLDQARRTEERRIRRVAAALLAANDAGELDCDPDAGAKLLCTTINGVQFEARKGISKADARSTLFLALDALR